MWALFIEFSTFSWFIHKLCSFLTHQILHNKYEDQPYNISPVSFAIKFPTHSIITIKSFIKKHFHKKRTITILQVCIKILFKRIDFMVLYIAIEKKNNDLEKLEKIFRPWHWYKKAVIKTTWKSKSGQNIIFSKLLSYLDESIWRGVLEVKRAVYSIGISTVRMRYR